MKQRELESLVGNIPTKLLEYETSLKKMIKDSEMGMQDFTSSILVVAASIGKASLDEANLNVQAPLLVSCPRKRTK